MRTVSIAANIDRTFERMNDAIDSRNLLESFTAPRPSTAERAAAGKALRDKVLRKAHAQFEKAKDRPDPVSILEAAEPHARAEAGAGALRAHAGLALRLPARPPAAVMAADLSETPVTGMGVGACGDMHVSNFGVFASAERNLIFAINDFDEVHPGPWEWDLKRLAASAAVSARFMGGDKADAEDAAQAIVRSYRERMRRYAEMGFLEIWYDRIDDRAILDTLSPRARRNAEKVMDKARSKGHVAVLEKLTEEVDGQHRIIEEVPLVIRETHTERGIPISEALDLMLRSYVDSLPTDRRILLSRYRIVDSARKVVGVGSVGTGCWVVLLRGIDNDDPLFLQVKQAQQSVLEPYVDHKLRFDNQGRRVVFGQRLTQGSPDIFWAGARSSITAISTCGSSPT